MFGLSFGEIVLLLIVGIVVVGPKKLPSMMRTAGQWVAKLRRLSTDLRSQSGIDDLIRQEGLEKEIHELRNLARMNVVDTLMNPGVAHTAAGAIPAAGAIAENVEPYGAAKASDFKPIAPLREREYPLIGCDAADAMPDDFVPYAPPAAEAAAPEGAADAKTGEPEAAPPEGDAKPADAKTDDAKPTDAKPADAKDEAPKAFGGLVFSSVPGTVPQGKEA